MIVLDTNVLSEIMRPQPDEQVKEWLLSIRTERLADTVITITEIEYGLQRLPYGTRQRDLRQGFAMFASGLVILTLDEFAATFAGTFRAKREGMGLPATPSDIMIAGIVMQVDGSLATRNIRDFEHLPIGLVNPWAGFSGQN